MFVMILVVTSSRFIYSHWPDNLVGFTILCVIIDIE